MKCSENLRLCLLIFLLVWSASCTQRISDKEIEAVIAETRRLLVPDPRLEIFEVDWERKGETLLLKGRVGRSSDLDSFRTILSERTGLSTDSQVVILPDPALGRETYGVVGVSTANMRRHPGHRAEMINQLLLGTEVRILEEEDSWVRVRSPEPYHGWLERGALETFDREALNRYLTRPKLEFRRLFGVLRDEPSTEARPVSDIVFGCRVTGKIDVNREWTAVVFPDGRSGYLPSRSLGPLEAPEPLRRIPEKELREVALNFLGVPYLWGGSSSKGFDCSGYARTIYSALGAKLLRDSDQQAAMGRQVELTPDLRHLRAGDLLYFGRRADDGQEEEVSHVGVYLGDLTFVHAASPRVHISSLDPNSELYDARNHERLLGARRLLEIVGAETSSTPEPTIL